MIDNLEYSSSHIVGIDYVFTAWAKMLAVLSEDNCPYYRNTVFSNYADSYTPSRCEVKDTVHGKGKAGMDEKRWSVLVFDV